MQDLTEKNTDLSQELQECKAQLEAALAAAGGTRRPPLVIHILKREVVNKMRRVRISDNNIAEGARLDPDKQQLLRQLKAGERVLTKVQQERNKFQDAHTQLGEELKGVRAQLSGSLKENQRLDRGIYSKCLIKLF